MAIFYKKNAYDVLFAFNSNNASISYCLRGTTSILSKVLDFHLPHIHLRSVVSEPLHISRGSLAQTKSSAIAEGPRDASCQLKSYQLPRNSAETTYTTSPDQIDGMKLEI